MQQRGILKVDTGKSTHQNIMLLYGLLIFKLWSRVVNSRKHSVFGLLSALQLRCFFVFSWEVKSIPRCICCYYFDL